MKIVVLIKEVPDTYGTRTLNLATGLADRISIDQVLDEIGERALEVALAYADKNSDVKVEVLSMVPSTSAANLRRSLAMGAGSAVLVSDDALVGADLGLTAEVLAAALRRIGFDLVIAGNLSTDGSAGVIPAMVAELLDVPSATALNTVEIFDGTVSGERASDGATMRVSARLPAVISITERLPGARFPTFKGTLAAKKRPLRTLSLDDLGVDVEDPVVPRSIVLAVSEKPPRKAGIKIVDAGDAGIRLAEFLVENGLA